MRKLLVFAAVLAVLGTLFLVAKPGARSTTAHPASAPTPASTTAVAPRAPAAWPRTPAPAMPAQLEPLFARLAAAGGDPEALEDASNDTYLALIAAFADPRVLAAVEEMLVGADPTTAEARVAVGALTGAGTPEAQAVMLRLLAARGGDVDFMRLLIPTMGFAVNPGRELEDALRTTAGNHDQASVRTVASLALGAVAAHVATSDPARAHKIVDEYRGKLSVASDLAAIDDSLEVLGNAGTAEVVQAVAPYLHDTRARVRADALEALRRIPTPEVESILLGALRDDAEADVRAAAAWALSYRQPTPATLSTQAAVLAAERSENVARTLLENLWGGLSSDRATVLAAVRSAADSHALPKVQELARSLLAGVPPG